MSLWNSFPGWGIAVVVLAGLVVVALSVAWRRRRRHSDESSMLLDSNGNDISGSPSASRRTYHTS